MLKKLQKNKSEGFTIIEVMIVLAIAGLILLIVFLAVPSLQRNGRNTQRKNDASAIASAIANYLGNNNGSLPSNQGVVTTDATHSVTFYCTTTPATITNVRASGVVTGCTTSSTNFEQAKLGYFDASAAGNALYFSNVTNAPTVVPTTTACSAANISSLCVVVNLRHSCDNNGGAPPVYNTNPRIAAVFYVTENGSGNGNLQCVDA